MLLLYDKLLMVALKNRSKRIFFNHYHIHFIGVEPDLGMIIKLLFGSDSIRNVDKM